MMKAEKNWKKQNQKILCLNVIIHLMSIHKLRCCVLSTRNTKLYKYGLGFSLSLHKRFQSDINWFRLAPQRQLHRVKLFPPTKQLSWFFLLRKMRHAKTRYHLCVQFALGPWTARCCRALALADRSERIRTCSG